MGKLIKMAWCNVWRNKGRTLIAVIAISLGLALMLFFDGLMGGAKQAIYGNTETAGWERSDPCSQLPGESQAVAAIAPGRC